METIVIRGKPQTFVRGKHGRYRTYITRDQWFSIFTAIVVMASVFFWGYLFGYQSCTKTTIYYQIQ